MFHQLCRLLRIRHGAFGLLLLAVFWPLNWLLPDRSLRTAYLFFPLWLGYILTVDALVLLRTGTSQLQRSPRAFSLLFLVSAPAWWLFELINHRTRNWEYWGSEFFTDLEYFLLCTLSFSTVMPAVLGTAELTRSFSWMNRLGRGVCLRPTQAMRLGLLGTGAALLTLMLAWPQYFYPFVWGSIFLMLEPLNAWLGRRTVFEWLRTGDWRPISALSVGALICGFFWEFWNYFSYPKWIYHTPGVEFLYVFEMPLLGYLGYLTFAWELYALRNFLWPQAPALRL